MYSILVSFLIPYYMYSLSLLSVQYYRSRFAWDCTGFPVSMIRNTFTNIYLCAAECSQGFGIDGFQQRIP